MLHRRRDSSSTAALQELGLTTLTLRRKLHMAQCMFRSLSSQAPPYLSRLFSYVSCHHNTRSSFTSQLNLPLVRSSFGQRAFSFAGDSLWCSLPTAIRATPNLSLNNFMELCKRFILMHERQFVLCNNMHTTELTILFYLFIYYLFIVHIVVFVLGTFVVASGDWPPQFK